MTQYCQKELFNKVSPFLLNKRKDNGRISFSCPFCQSDIYRDADTLLGCSSRNAYIFFNENTKYKHYVFYCQNEDCGSRIMSTGSGGIYLERFVKYIFGGLRNVPGFHGSRDLLDTKKEDLLPPSNERSQARSVSAKDPKPTVCRRLTPQEQAGAGGGLEKKLKQRREAKKHYWERRL